MTINAPKVETVVDLARLVAAIGGLALLGYGCALAWHPLGFIVPGALLFGVGTIGALRRS